MLFANYKPPFAKTENEGFSFWIKVTPKASKNRIGEISEGSFAKQLLKVYVTAPPSDNLANQAVIEILSKYLHCPKSRISIISGHTTREKHILVKN